MNNLNLPYRSFMDLLICAVIKNLVVQCHKISIGCMTNHKMVALSTFAEDDPLVLNYNHKIMTFISWGKKKILSRLAAVKILNPLDLLWNCNNDTKSKCHSLVSLDNQNVCLHLTVLVTKMSLTPFYMPILHWKLKPLYRFPDIDFSVIQSSLVLFCTWTLSTIMD